jgi:hypothetical protein
MTFTSDPAFAANYAAYEQIVAESNQGTWNPRYGLCEYMSQSTKMNIVAKYLPSSAGCLAPLMDKTSLDYVKQNVGTVAFVDASNLNAGTTVPVFFYYTGLSFQTYGQVALSVIDAAMFGNVYRYAQFYGSTN